MTSSDRLGTEKVKKLIFNLGWPAALNFSVSSIYNITDVIFVGRWLGSVPLAAVAIVGSINLLFSTFGIVIGFGGSSIIARALGEKDPQKASNVFGNQIILIATISLSLVAAGFIFEDFFLRSFGAYGEIFAPARIYYRILLAGVPFLCFNLMGNIVIQAGGKAKTALVNSLLPTAINILLNIVFIKGLHMGIAGSAWATLTGFIVGFFMVIRSFSGQNSVVKLIPGSIKFNPGLVREIGKIGGSILINVLVANSFIVLLNKVLFKYQQESGVVIYSIINRVSTLLLIPIIGIDGGIRPIIGYNFGSHQMDRIRDTVYSAIKYGMSICYIILAVVFLSADYLIHLFTDDIHILTITPFSMKMVFSFSPLFVIDIITIAYFQSIGKPGMAACITIMRNIVLLIPLLYFLPRYFGYNGILYAFPIVDILTTIPAFWILRNELKVRLPQRLNASIT